MADVHPLLLILPRQSDWAEASGLPQEPDNLFQRLIRNPHIESPRPRERECTEMLCAVLRNTGKLRLHLLKWLAALSGKTIPDLDDLEVVIDTEQAIGSKRDDLRIEGWRATGDAQEAVFLWTIEVKVGATFHYGSPLELPGLEEEEETEDGTEEEAEEDESLVSQIANYDEWLSQQPAKHLAGFVLAIQDKTAQLPADLKCDWECFTWTHLGLHVKAALDKGLPADESLLARHMLGFIRHHLWSASQMAEEDINFDDVALLRAFPSIGLACERKVDRLVGRLHALLEEYGIGHGQIGHQQSIFKGNARSVVYRKLFDRNFYAYPDLLMGIGNGQLRLWLETPSKNDKKRQIVNAVHAVHEKLRQRNPNWEAASVEEPRWRDLKLTLPLSKILDVPDQSAAFIEFFRNALEDMNVAGVVEAIERAIRKSDS